MSARKLGTLVGRLVVVAAFGIGAVIGGAVFDFHADKVVTADSGPVAPDSTEWT
jgi:hypothetical protein